MRGKDIFHCPPNPRWLNTGLADTSIAVDKSKFRTAEYSLYVKLIKIDVAVGYSTFPNKSINK